MAETPAPAAPSVIATVERDIVWIRGHILASILAIALIAGSIIGGVGLFESMIERHDARVAAAQQAKEGVDTSTTAALVAQLQQEHADNMARDAAQQATINTLISRMSAEHAATNKQISVDATLNAQAAAQRLIQQTKATNFDVTVNNDIVSMDLPVTRTVIASLDLLPQAQSDVQNLQGQLAAEKILTLDSKTELSTANQTISADKTELIATIKADNAACKVEVDAQAKKGRKRGIWATIAGFVGGAIVRSLL
jgi:hypothetical protein